MWNYLNSFTRGHWGPIAEVLFVDWYLLFTVRQESNIHCTPAEGKTPKKTKLLNTYYSEDFQNVGCLGQRLFLFCFQLALCNSSFEVLLRLQLKLLGSFSLVSRVLGPLCQ